MAQYKISGHGVVEHNFLASEATRQIEAQTPVKDGIETLENGMILFIDRKKNEIVKEEVSCPYLMHSTVRYYRAGERGLNHFVFNVNNEEELPRLWKLSEGDSFHTNLISGESTEAIDALFKANESLYGYPDGNGMIRVTDTKDENAKCEFIVKKSTMQNDEVGFYVVVNKA
jgi:hypothetical protein